MLLISSYGINFKIDPNGNLKANQCSNFFFANLLEVRGGIISSQLNAGEEKI